MFRYCLVLMTVVDIRLSPVGILRNHLYLPYLRARRLSAVYKYLMQYRPHLPSHVRALFPVCEAHKDKEHRGQDLHLSRLQ